MSADEREPGEAFCRTCPDNEACYMGYPCDLVKRIATTPAPSGEAAEPTTTDRGE